MTVCRQGYAQSVPKRDPDSNPTNEVFFEGVVLMLGAVLCKGRELFSNPGIPLADNPRALGPYMTGLC